MSKLQTTARSMNLSSFQFRPQPLPTLVMVLSVALLVSLGMWQLERADQQTIRASDRDFRRMLPPMVIGDAPLQQQWIEHRSLVAKGEYLPAKTVLIENRKYRGTNGFHVITPLDISGSDRYLLVNRGWVPPGTAGSRPIIPTPSGILQVRGEAWIPQPPPLRLARVSNSSTLVPQWPYITLEDYETWSGLNIYPFAVLQDERDPHGFVRAWPAAKDKHAMHIGYALQWFAFALIVLLSWLKLSQDSSAEERSTESE